MTAKTAAPAKAPSEALLLEIAAKHFFLETLETRDRVTTPFNIASTPPISPFAAWKAKSPMAEGRADQIAFIASNAP